MVFDYRQFSVLRSLDLVNDVFIGVKNWRMLEVIIKTYTQDKYLKKSMSMNKRGSYHKF